MRLLEEKILTDGEILPGGVLKVNTFLNHQIDVSFLRLLAEEVYEHYKDFGINKILTVEASGIGLACIVAEFFKCKVLVAKKHKSLNLSPDVYSAKVYSFTHQRENTVIVAKEFISADDRILIVDDFLANGNACIGLIELAKMGGAQVMGVSCAVEKSWQGGHDRLVELGYDVFSLARVESMSDSGEITFVKNT